MQRKGGKVPVAGCDQAPKLLRYGRPGLRGDMGVTCAYRGPAAVHKGESFLSPRGRRLSINIPRQSFHFANADAILHFDGFAVFTRKYPLWAPPASIMTLSFFANQLKTARTFAAAGPHKMNLNGRSIENSSDIRLLSLLTITRGASTPRSLRRP